MITRRDGRQNPGRRRHPTRPDIVIIARSDARAVEGLQASIDRVNAYLEAGADVGFVEAPQNTRSCVSPRAS